MPQPLPRLNPAADSDTRRWLRTDNLLLLGLLGLVVWLTADVLLLIFAGLLLAIGIDGFTAFLKDRTPLSRGWALLIVILLVLGFLGFIGYIVVPEFLGELDDLGRQVSAVGGFIQDMLERLGLADELIKPEELPIADAAGAVMRQTATALMTTIGILGGLIIMTAIALFAVVNPELYRCGFLRLLPRDQRPRVAETLSRVAHALRWWFLSQLISMVLLGVSISLGLMIIGIDLWLSLGVLTGLLTFIPYLGPIIAGIPIVIIGFTQGMETGIIVLVFYLIVQNIEAQIVVPIIQHRVVNLAPVLAISTQVLMGALFGVLGVIFAAPVTIVAMVAVRKLYMEDVLDELPER
jgi:predicted PurR-regulated permease PerM